MNAVVPEGHQVILYKAQLPAEVSRTKAGAVLVNLPLSDDEPPPTLESVFAQIEAALREGETPVTLSRAQGVLSDLFAPHTPPVQQVPALMIWMVQHGSFNGWIETPEQREQLKHRLLDVTHGYACVAFVRGVTAPVMELLWELQWDVRDAPGNDCFVEVVRPEGVVVMALLGGPASTQTQPPDDEPPLRSGHLQERLRNADSDLAGLYQTLLDRTPPLVLLVNAQNRGLAPRRWPAGEGFPAFADRISAQWALDDMGNERAAFTFGGISAVDLFKWAREAMIGVAICFYDGRQTPRSVYIPWEDVRELSEGRLPSP